MKIALVVDNTRGNTLTIIHMTDHTNPEIIGSETYNAAGYTHQGWLSEDQTHLFLDGEFLHSISFTTLQPTEKIH